MSAREENIERRTKFYNNPDVAKFLNKEGIPNSKRSMNAMMIAGGSGAVGSIVESSLFDCLNHVTFAKHPQQINIRDKANGMIIAVIRR
jgi:hypothetical protein